MKIEIEKLKNPTLGKSNKKLLVHSKKKKKSIIRVKFKELSQYFPKC